MLEKFIICGGAACLLALFQVGAADDAGTPPSPNPPESQIAQDTRVLTFDLPGDRKPENASATPASGTSEYEADGLGAIHNDQAAIQRGKTAALEGEVESLGEIVSSLRGELEDNNEILRWLKANVATKEDIKGLKQVIVEYRSPSTGKGSQGIMLNKYGHGSVSLPPDAVVTSIGGVAAESWETNAAASPILSSGNGSNGGSVSSTGNGSNGGSVRSTPANAVQASSPVLPMTSTIYEGTPILSSSSFSLQGQTDATLVNTPEMTELSLSLSPDYLGDPANQYCDPITGECGPTVSTASSVVLPRLGSRLRSRQPIRNTARRLRGR